MCYPEFSLINLKLEPFRSLLFVTVYSIWIFKRTLIFLQISVLEQNDIIEVDPDTKEMLKALVCIMYFMVNLSEVLFSTLPCLYKLEPSQIPMSYVPCIIINMKCTFLLGCMSIVTKHILPTKIWFSFKS